jgi:protoporphyrinogen/coproporphyrinogen III oxidase
MNRIIVVGGGIAGLSAAYYAQKNIPTRTSLIESASYWGGKITTDRVSFDDGQFIIEGGPDTFLASKPWGVALCKELGLGERLHGTNQNKKNTYVLNKGRLLPLPEGLAMMIPSDVPSILRSRLISWFGKTRMGLDFLLPAKNVNPDKTGAGGDESLGSFVSRRLGREAYENLIEPLMSGIYAGDGDQLSLAPPSPICAISKPNTAVSRAARSKCAKNPTAKRFRVRALRFSHPLRGWRKLLKKLVESLIVKRSIYASTLAPRSNLNFELECGT